MLYVADPHLDGINQWEALSRGTPSPRHEFIYGINQRTGKAAIR